MTRFDKISSMAVRTISPVVSLALTVVLSNNMGLYAFGTWIKYLAFAVIASNVIEFGYTPYVLRESQVFRKREISTVLMVAAFVLVPLVGAVFLMNYAPFEVFVLVAFIVLNVLLKAICANLRISGKLLLQQSLEWVALNSLTLIFAISIGISSWASVFLIQVIGLAFLCGIGGAVAFRDQLLRNRYKYPDASPALSEHLIDRMQLTINHLVARNILDLKVLFTSLIFGSPALIAQFKFLSQIFEFTLLGKAALVNIYMLKYKGSVVERTKAIQDTKKFGMIYYAAALLILLIAAQLVKRLDYDMQLLAGVPIVAAILLALPRFLSVASGPLAPLLTMNGHGLFVLQATGALVASFALGTTLAALVFSEANLVIVGAIDMVSWFIFIALMRQKVKKVI